MSLYELSNDFQTLYEALDNIDLNDDNGENLLTAYFDTLEGIEGEFDQKAGKHCSVYQRTALRG